MQYGIIPEAFIFAYVDGLKELEDFFLVKEADEWFLKALFRNTEDCIGQLTLLRVRGMQMLGSVISELMSFSVVVYSTLQREKPFNFFFI